MKMTNKEYGEYIKKKSPNTNMVGNVLKAFLSGGLICVIGQGILNLFKFYELGADEAGSATSVVLVFLGALLTGLGVYDRMAKFSGAGTLVPITGFANSIVSPAIEFKSEGYVSGMSAKMFVIAGPVLVFGISASVIYGILLAIIK
ncbi:MAG: stage V sporulation protein AC [Clostridiales bacterium]|jgi:stage V sporulation protein AC|nr:stage V sporulation protein AC [Clostridiales bacterium]